MDTLFKLRDSLVDYISPSSKRRRTIGPGTPSRDAAEHEYLPISEPRGPKEQAAAFDFLKRKYFSTPDSKNPRKRAREEDEDQYEISPGDSVSQITPEDVSIEEFASQDEEDDEDEHMADDEEEGESEDEEQENPEDVSKAKVQEFLARQEELALRKGDVEKVRADGGWHKDAIFLYERIALRSFEQLIHADWRIDFPTLPEDLFTRDDEKTFVNANCLPRSRAVKALQGLLSLGVRVRDMVLVDRPPEKIVAREIKSYIKWSEQDGGFFKMRFIPVLHVVAARPGQSTAALSTAITTEMKFLAARHRQHLKSPEQRINELGDVELYTKPLPLLYGMIIAQTKIIFVTVDPADPESQVKPLSNLDLTKRDMDVWNGFAIAFMVIVARNYIMSIKDELEPDSESDPDVDA